MAFDNLVFNQIVNLIKEPLINGKISKIQQISQEEFLFMIRNNNQNYNFLINTHPNTAYMNLVSKKPESNYVTSNFGLFIKKHLENGKIINILQQNDDRIVLLEISNFDDYFNHTIKKLYVELIGRASNIILCDEDNKILECLKKIPLQYNNLRPLLPNIKYELPNVPEKSSLPSSIINELNYRNISLEQLKEIIKKSTQIFIKESKEKKDFHFFEFLYFDGKVKVFPWNIGIEEFYKDVLIKERHRQYNAELEKVVKNEIKKAEKKLVKLQQEQENARKNQVYKIYGDLLLTYSDEISPYDDAVVLKDELGNEYKIALDKRLNVFKNAQSYYKKYQKSKTAIDKIKEQINLTEDNLDYFKTIKFHLDNADVIVANEIKEELMNQGFFKQKNNLKKNNKKNKEKAYRPQKYIFNNVSIEVGQNNLQNEYLTFKLSNKNDWFFHVQNGPGAHVVVHENKLNEALIRYAANLAAINSSQKNSSSVAVNYTLIKNVKKIPGGKPGKVIIKDQKTIFIDPK